MTERDSLVARLTVTDEMVELLVQATRKYTRETLFIEEHREMIRAALEAALASPADEPQQPADASAGDVAGLVEQLNSHMGKQDVSVLLADCRAAANALTRQSEQIASLTKERDEARAEVERMTPNFVAYDYLESPVRADVAEAEVAALKSRLSDLEQEAVKVVGPFGAYLDQANFDLDNNGNQVPDDQGMGWVYLTVGDFRAARTFLAKLKGSAS